MPMNLRDHMLAFLNNRRSTGAESSLFASMVNAPSPYANKSLIAPVAPPNVPHSINPAGCHESLLGMQDIESGSSHFLSWIDGKGPYVPLPLPADAVPQVVVVNNWCHGLTDEMFEKENLKRASSQFGAHPSPLIAPLNDLWPVLGDLSPTLCHERRGPPIVETRCTRLKYALAFRNHFTNTMGKGTCIWSDGTYPWSGKSCGIMWVAVHGMHSICVVTKNEDLVQEVRRCMRASDLSKEDFLLVFRQGIIYEVEELAKTLEKEFGQSCEKPFGVVSVIPGTHEGSGHQASSAEYDEEKAIKFLGKEMESNTAFTFNKTVQTAISAFQQLFCQKFKANEIRVIVWKKDGDIVKELPSRDDRSIEEHVAIIRAR